MLYNYYLGYFVDLTKITEIVNIATGTKIYQKDDKPDNFYVIIQGALFMEAEVEVSKRIRYPVGHNKWEVKVTTHLVKYRVRELDKLDMFGHQEIIFRSNRVCDVIAVEPCVLLKISKENFQNLFVKDLQNDLILK